MSHTLLLADDSVTIQRVIELTFADEGVRVVAVSDGHEAIARIDEAPPDIVLADVGMPGPDGYEVARHVRNTPRLAHIPVLLLTGAFEPVDPTKAAEVGCQGVLTKPFEPQLVIQRVKALLAGAPGDASPAGPSRQTARSRAVAATAVPLADAFAALLAAERSGASPSLPRGWPAPADQEALVEDVVQRVLDRVSARIVFEAVSQITLDVAERLVREEIARIRDRMEGPA